MGDGLGGRYRSLVVGLEGDYLFLVCLELSFSDLLMFGDLTFWSPHCEEPLHSQPLRTAICELQRKMNLSPSEFFSQEVCSQEGEGN